MCNQRLNEKEKSDFLFLWHIDQQQQQQHAKRAPLLLVRDFQLCCRKVFLQPFRRNGNTNRKENGFLDERHPRTILFSYFLLCSFILHFITQISRRLTNLRITKEKEKEKENLHQQSL